MLISTRGRYGLKATAFLTRLALGGAGDSAPVNRIARETSLPENYLEGILRDLKAVGVVASVRGLKGGYRLARPPSEITIGAIMRATEGDMAPAPCLSAAADSARLCGNCDGCDTKEAWEEIFEKFNEVLDSITLDKLVKTG